MSLSGCCQRQDEAREGGEGEDDDDNDEDNNKIMQQA